MLNHTVQNAIYSRPRSYSSVILCYFYIFQSLFELLNPLQLLSCFIATSALIRSPPMYRSVCQGEIIHDTNKDLVHSRISAAWCQRGSLGTKKCMEIVHFICIASVHNKDYLKMVCM